MPTIGATIAHPHIAYSKVWISSRLPLGGDGVDEVQVMKRSMRKNRHGGAFLFSKVGEALDVKGMLKSKTPHGRGEAFDRTKAAVYLRRVRLEPAFVKRFGARSAANI